MHETRSLMNRGSPHQAGDKERNEDHSKCNEGVIEEEGHRVDNGDTGPASQHLMASKE